MKDRVKTQADAHELFLTPTEIAERLKVDEDTVRRLFLNEPGSIVICFLEGQHCPDAPRAGERVRRVLARFSIP